MFPTKMHDTSIVQGFFFFQFCDAIEVAIIHNMIKPDLATY